MLRYTARNLHADGIMQSVMSLQGVELFFWGQNRFASVVPLLTGVIVDPDANLFGGLLLNALSFHGLLLLLARMGTSTVAGDRRWSSTLVLFVALEAVVNLVVVPYQVYTIALHTQPYSLSWLLAVGGFLWWCRPHRAFRVAAAALVGVAVGLNPSVALGALFLALVRAVRTGCWRPWAAFAAVWAAWFAVWFWLAARYGRTDAVAPGMAGSYYGFEVGRFAEGFGRSVEAIVGAFASGWLVLIAGLCLLGILASDRRAQRALLPRFALIGLFCLGYTALFAGNGWVAANQYPVRYFFPVLLAITLGFTAPIVAAALRLADGRLSPPAARRTALIAAGTVGVAAVAGPITLPTDADILGDVRATADYAASHDVPFLAGNYWVVWPALYLTMSDGRPGLAANYKAGGDPARYPERLDLVLATGHRPLALCLNDSAAGCVADLDRWTRPGWSAEPDGTCPIADPPAYADSTVSSCIVLGFAG